MFDKLVALRADLKSEAIRRSKLGSSDPNLSAASKLSYMPILLKATSLALQKFPQLNATINSDATELTQYSDHNIGVAMDSPKGLIVPVIRGVQKKSIFELAAEMAGLQVMYYYFLLLNIVY